MIKVMYSIYGDPEGPWHFGSTNGKMEGGSIEINLTINGTPSHTYAKLVVPFKNFNPNDLKSNVKYNLCGVRPCLLMKLYPTLHEVDIPK